MTSILRPPRTFSRCPAFLKCAPLAAALCATLSAPLCAAADAAVDTARCLAAAYPDSVHALGGAVKVREQILAVRRSGETDYERRLNDAGLLDQLADPYPLDFETPQSDPGRMRDGDFFAAMYGGSDGAAIMSKDGKRSFLLLPVAEFPFFVEECVPSDRKSVV